MARLTIVDTDIVLNMFSKDRNSALENLKHYLSETNEDKCLEYDGKCKEGSHFASNIEFDKDTE